MFWGFVIMALILSGVGLFGRIFMGFSMLITIFLFLFAGLVLAFGFLLLLMSVVPMVV